MAVEISNQSAQTQTPQSNQPASIQTPQKPQLVKNFWPKLRRGTLILIVLLQVFILIALAAVLHYLGFFTNSPLIAVATLIAQSILGIVASLVIYHFVARPIKHLLAALVHVAGEATNTPPPNPNQTKFEKSGFKPVLQTIYQLAADAKDPLQEDSDTKIPTQNGQSQILRAFDQAICGFVVMDKNRQIIYANKSTPISVDTAGVKSLNLMFQDGNTIYNWWNECDQTAVKAEKTWPRISDKLPNEEDRHYFDVIASYEKGAEAEVVLTLIDRTHLYEIGEEELDFIAFAAHELRGPITVIRGYIDVLQDEMKETLQDDQKELFRRLVVSANRLSGYVNNILNTSRFDRRHLRMHLVEASIKNIYETIKDDMDLRARSQNRILSVAIPDGLPSVAADPSSLSEVFSNLIDNAIKYSNEGGTINVSAVSKGDTVEFSVEDHGIGMPSSVVSNLFQKFYRSHRSRETVAGTGIGLYISKAIVESHGGTILVKSEDGHGSTFTISLPNYKMVADKLQAGNNGNEVVINNDGSWIKNHNMYRG